MTATNQQIQKALHDKLEAAALGYPIAYPAVDFIPPASGVWLEVSFLPNRGIDDGVNANSSVIPQGIYQVMVVDRAGRGLFPVTNAAQSVMGAFPHTSAVVGGITIQRKPYQGSAIKESDRVMIPVTVEYTG